MGSSQGRLRRPQPVRGRPWPSLPARSFLRAANPLQLPPAPGDRLPPRLTQHRPLLLTLLTRASRRTAQAPRPQAGRLQAAPHGPQAALPAFGLAARNHCCCAASRQAPRLAHPRPQANTRRRLRAARLLHLCCPPGARASSRAPGSAQHTQRPPAAARPRRRPNHRAFLARRCPLRCTHRPSRHVPRTARMPPSSHPTTGGMPFAAPPRALHKRALTVLPCPPSPCPAGASGRPRACPCATPGQATRRPAATWRRTRALLPPRCNTRGAGPHTLPRTCCRRRDRAGMRARACVRKCLPPAASGPPARSRRACRPRAPAWPSGRRHRRCNAPRTAPPLGPPPTRPRPLQPSLLVQAAARSALLRGARAQV